MAGPDPKFVKTDPIQDDWEWWGNTCHPDAPLGGGGTGFFTIPGPVKLSDNYLQWDCHPFSPAGLLQTTTEVKQPPSRKLSSDPRWAKLSEGWRRTMNEGIGDPAWDEYDTLIQQETAAYNERLAQTPGFAPLDWKLFKAMVWVESGGAKNPAWKQRAMQIGNPGDPGYATLKKRAEGSDLIMSDELHKAILKDINDPNTNIKAGMAYLLTRLLQTDIASVADPDDKEAHEYTAAKGDSFWKLQKSLSTTEADLKQMNPGMQTIRPGQVIKYRKAAMKRIIKGWLPMTPQKIFERYNIGDPQYPTKLEYVLDLFK